MKKVNKTLLFLSLCFLMIVACSKKDLHEEILVTDLSENNWFLWLDKDAEWFNDSLHFPPVDISKLPVNPPTCGWDSLNQGVGKKISVPATVEEHFWGFNGNHFGISGDYKGVSWFSTTVFVPDHLKGKRLVLQFESVRVRAEIYVNRKLAGYDIINGTPFEVDITDHVEYGSKNYLAVRITDPNGNFTWCDFQPYPWGNVEIPPSHGFGGITGKVLLHVSDPVYVSDVFIKNKPQPRALETSITLQNRLDKDVKGRLNINVLSRDQSAGVLKDTTVEVTAAEGESEVAVSFYVQDARLWSPESPVLYDLKVAWEGDNETSDVSTNTFGFRWFEVRNVDGDKQYYLNGKRIVLRTAISWGFWPVNGIYPTEAMAVKQVETAKKIGLNMLNFHRGIGQPNILDAADRLGLLYYEEPGSYKDVLDSEFIRKWRRAKLFRMIRRDRNHPSLIIYNLQNEIYKDPDKYNIQDIKDAHKIDETRPITYTSSHFGKEFYDGKCPKDTAPVKLHMLPYDHKVYYFGWWDEHHAGGPGCYKNAFYNAPDDYRRFTSHKEEIIFYGEEGAIGTPPRLELIRDEIIISPLLGWDSKDYLAWYEAYNTFLDEQGFREAFPTVDSLTQSMGDVAFYYQGRTIENIRINNTIDGYAVNGWEGMKLENHSGIVDCYRNPKGHVGLIAKYCKPLFVSVKARNVVLKNNEPVIIDCHIVNEKDLKGTHILKLEACRDTATVFSAEYKVSVSGGHQYGQLLQDSIVIPGIKQGYLEVNASLENATGEQVADGSEKVFYVAAPGKNINASFMVIDSTGWINDFLEREGLGVSPKYTGGRPDADIVIGGKDQIPQDYGVQEDLIDWIMEGHSLVIVDGADQWAQYLEDHAVVEYKGRLDMGEVWYGGNYFVKENPLFEGLPVNCALNWEYQAFVNYGRERYGIRIKNVQTVTGAVSDHKQEVVTAVGIIPLGKGKIIISTLDMKNAINDTVNGGCVARKLFMNYLNYASK